MGMVSLAARTDWKIRIRTRRDRDRRELAFVDPPGYSRARREGRPHVLARHHAVGAVGGLVRTARRLYHQSPAFFAAVDESVLGVFGLISESRRVLAESGHAHNTVRLSAIFSRRQAPLDRGPGAVGNGARGQNQIRAGELRRADSDAWPGLVVMSHAENAMGKSA